MRRRHGDRVTARSPWPRPDASAPSTRVTILRPLNDPSIALTWTSPDTVVPAWLRHLANQVRPTLTYSDPTPIITQLSEPVPGTIAVHVIDEDYAVARALMAHPHPGLHSAFAVNTFLTCADGLILAVRASHLDTMPGHLSATASEGVNASDITRTTHGDAVDVNAVSRRALAEELGLADGDVTGVAPFGYTFTSTGLYVFTATWTDLTFAAVCARQAQAPDWEGALELCPPDGPHLNMRPAVPWLPAAYAAWTFQRRHPEAEPGATCGTTP